MFMKYVLLAFSFMMVSCHLAGDRNPASVNEVALRVNNESPIFYVEDKDVELFESYAGFDEVKQESFHNLTIHKKAKQMIADAKDYIIASVFLFDNMYSQKEPTFDLVKQLTDQLLAKKRENPSIVINIILDPLHKGYAHRESPAIKLFRAHGINVFYSDLLETKSAGPEVVEAYHETSRFLDNVTDAITNNNWSKLQKEFGKAKIPFVKRELDGDKATLALVRNALLLKANHRKILVTDNDEGEFEALISSANPHNASLPSANYALSTKGELAKYIYNVLRLDILKSHELGWEYAYWSPLEGNKLRHFSRVFPKLHVDIQSEPEADRNVGVQFVSEVKVRDSIIKMLEGVEADDQVRIQMFYFSSFPVLQALMDAAERTNKPIRLLLDPNKDAFNTIKDGSPNRQVAAYLMEMKKKYNLNLDIKWFSTHGEQNHAKIISVTNERTGKYLVNTGSTNWTRKNLDGINMEANLLVIGSERLNQKFDSVFDMFWENRQVNVTYSLAWDDPAYKYNEHAGMEKWAKPKKVLSLFPVKDEKGRTIMIENKLVSW